MSAPEKIKELVRNFAKNIDQYKSTSYNETETRIEFLNPFWGELGWDMENRQGYAQNYRDVIHEDAIRLRGTSDTNVKAPDYAFRIGGIRKFFLEAKKPSVVIRTDSSPAYQLRCYGWSCKLALSVLSDFEEFAIYNCRVKPEQKDSASVARIKYLTYTDYVDHWDELAEIFHRENILKGSFDRFVDSKKSTAGTTEVDTEFLKEIEHWRQILANDLARNNTNLSVRELNHAVQITMDRILFLRMAEDRGIEPENQLENLLKAPNVYQRLLSIFLTADEKYNSGFFHFQSEKDETEPHDTLTQSLTVSDRVLNDILKRLYSPQSPYRFDVFPVEILGSVYERFLGSEIRLTPSRMAKVEEKPEVRKAGGVYYTPGYIVDYIVQNTVGKLCEGKSPKEVSTIKILDPACGSGSFLICAYKYLLDWHLKWYIAEYEQTQKIPQSPPVIGARKKKSDPNAIVQTENGGWKLTLSERKRILLNNIYGVDLDAQAVEVTKLSLSLAVLEGANNEMLEYNLGLFYDRALPNLASNIKCGNSLIASDFYNNEQTSLFDSEQQLKVNAFDWDDDAYGFGKIMKAGGFDVVIGNPPYVFTRNDGFRPEEKDYYYSKYCLVQYQLNTYIMFSEQGEKLLKTDGLLGFIMPNNWMTIDTTSLFRKHILQTGKDIYLVNCLDKVFQDANVDTCILIYSKTGNSILHTFYLKGHEYQKIRETDSSHFFGENTSIINFTQLENEEAFILCRKIEENSLPLNSIVVVKAGIKAYEVGKGHPVQSVKMKDERVYHSRVQENDAYIQYLDGVDVARYSLGWSGQFIKYGNNLAAPRKAELFVGPRILVRQIPAKPPYSVLASYLEHTYINDLNSMIVKKQENDYSLFYILGLINSRLMTYWFNLTFGKLQRKLFPQFKVKELAQFPIRPIDFSNKIDVEIHDKIVHNVEQLLDLNKQLPTITNPQKRELTQRRISSLDRQIDTLVYDLYGLTEEERQLCEQSQ